MGWIDIVREGIRAAADESSGDDDGDGDSSGDIFGSLSRFFGGSGDDGGSYGDDADDGDSDSSDDDGGGSGWDLLDRFVDRFSGDSRHDPLVDGLVDQVRPYLPSEVRNVADSLLNSDSGRAAPGVNHAPGAGQPSASAASGHGYGEGGFDGVRHSALPPDAGWMGPEPWDTPSDLDRNGNGLPDNSVFERQAIYDQNWNGVPDMLERQATPYDQDGNGVPDMLEHRPLDRDGDGFPDEITDPDGDGVPNTFGRRPTSYDGDTNRDSHAYGRQGRPDDRPGDGIPGDYDGFVTSGAAAAGHPAPAYHVPDDPTFPTDDAPASVAAVTPVESDFQQSIDDADQVESSMDDMVEGLA